MLAGTIGSRAVGTPANQRAREYIIDQLKLFGFEVRVQETDARRPELGQTAHVVNIIASLPGARPEAIGLVAHYDSRPEAPGATDDALGVAIALEAARVFAGRSDRQWSLLVLLTDGEEADLMGAAALMTDREVTRSLTAYLQVESIGSNGPALLFETGPDNQWLVSAWAHQAPHPRGGSFALEIYKRLPSDTDFSIIKRQEIPGLNFAPVGDSYAYHTARDTPDRLSQATIRDTGENIVGILNALNGTDIAQRSSGTGTYFDIAGTTAIVYGPLAGQILSIGALLLGVVAWIRVTAAAIRMAGLLRWILTFLWSAIGAVLVFASMTGATWALRAGREMYHPWYAKPDRLFALLLAVAALVGWSVSRAGAWLPARAHGLRHPLVAWTVTLPVWIALAAGAFMLAPSAVYLWTIPLFVAGALLTVVRPTSAPAVRIVSLVVFDVAAVLWLHETIVLLRFLVATLGRFPIVTPAFVYAMVMLLAGVMLVPPLLGALAAWRPLFRPSLVTSLGLIALTVTAGLAYRGACVHRRSATPAGRSSAADAGCSERLGGGIDRARAGSRTGCTRRMDAGVDRCAWRGAVGPLEASVRVPNVRSGDRACSTAGDAVNAAAGRRRSRAPDLRRSARTRPHRVLRAPSRRRPRQTQPAGPRPRWLLDGDVHRRTG